MPTHPTKPLTMRFCKVFEHEGRQLLVLQSSFQLAGGTVTSGTVGGSCISSLLVTTAWPGGPQAFVDVSISPPSLSWDDTQQMLAHFNEADAHELLRTLHSWANGHLTDQERNARVDAVQASLRLRLTPTPTATS